MSEATTISQHPGRKRERGLDNVRFVKALGLVNGIIPAALLGWDAWHGQLGAVPLNSALFTTGIVSLIFLTLMLAVTPVRKFTGAQSLYGLRRIFGLYAFFYAVIHFGIYFYRDGRMNVGFTLNAIFESDYLVWGFYALIAMVPLAVTSTSGMIRLMGAKNWKRLHMLAYVAAACGMIHFLKQGKSYDWRHVAFSIGIFGLLAYRPIAWLVEQGRLAPNMDKFIPPKKWRGKMKVAAIRRETPNVQTFQLVGETGGVPFAHEAGQYLTVALKIDGKPVYRNYTIASSPTSSRCEVTVKREDMGLGSRHLHDAVKVGDMLDISAPAGDFVFSDSGKPVVMLAGGVGITPLMAMLRAMIDCNWNGKIFLIYSNRTPQDVIFERELAEFQSRVPNLTVVHTLTRDAGPEWKGERGRIDAAKLQRIVGDVKDRAYYICGPNEMIEAARTMLLSLGVASKDIHEESFGSRPTGASFKSDGKTFAVTFEKSRLTADVPDSAILLEAAELLGIPAEFECRSGTCGTCKCKLKKGTVTMAVEDALDETEKKSGTILLCQARPTSDVVIDL